MDKLYVGTHGCVWLVCLAHTALLRSGVQRDQGRMRANVVDWSARFAHVFVGALVGRCISCYFIIAGTPRYNEVYYSHVTVKVRERMDVPKLPDFKFKPAERT